VKTYTPETQPPLVKALMALHDALDTANIAAERARRLSGWQDDDKVGLSILDDEVLASIAHNAWTGSKIAREMARLRAVADEED
jgi:hypothetical protein